MEYKSHEDNCNIISEKTYLAKMQDERILKEILNFLVNFILNILIKCILIKKKCEVGRWIWCGEGRSERVGKNMCV